MIRNAIAAHAGNSGSIRIKYHHQTLMIVVSRRAVLSEIPASYLLITSKRNYDRVFLSFRISASYLLVTSKRNSDRISNVVRQKLS